MNENKLKQGSKYFKALLVFMILMLNILSVTFMSSCKKSDEASRDYAQIIDDSRTLITEVMAKENIPGLSVALIDENKVIWTEGFGYTDNDKKTQVTQETIFSIQSISKTITATASMAAVQDGMIDLNEPISTYLPDFTVNSRFDEKPQDKICIRQLLSHYAGFTMEAPVGNNVHTESPSFEAHIMSVSDTWLRYPIGQRYSYSNLGVDLAGYILQEKSGKSFPDYVKEVLLNPIGMKSSSFDMDVIKKNENRAIGHCLNIPDAPLEIPMIPSGGFYSNVKDMAKFVQFHLSLGKVKGKSVLNPDLLDEMYTIPYPVDGQYAGYALGIDKDWDDKRKVFYYNHGGGGFGFLANMVWYPDYGVGLIILTNNDSNSTQSQLTSQILELLLKQKQPADNPDIDDENAPASSPYNLADIKKYSGNYMGRNLQLDVITDNRITFTFDKDDSYQGEFITPNICRLGSMYYKFIPAGITPAYIVRTNDGVCWDYNYGPVDQPGPAKKEWEDYMGNYTAKVYGQLPLSASVQLINGYLHYIDPYGYQIKFIEYEPGLFFASNGECLDFRGETPMFTNIKVQKAD